ncbi:hypothetical protein [Pseudanabaena sp. BC1403]|uniref:hypothetical protein n=1 Tax=Pseudanabaena sp. BC1403 TaxID=2043171 RepID=UPI000CD858A6|nr:hypothetical protein [Pseudanabaena sp. BC1403]
MPNDDYAPYLINDRSSSLLHLIDAFQFTESELSDVYDGVFNRMKNAFAPDNSEKPLTPIDVRAVREYVATLNNPPISQDTADWMRDRRPTKEEVDHSLTALVNDLKSDTKLLFEVEVLEAYMLLGMVQAAIVSLDIPENLEKFGRKFIGAFCDRYRIKYPDLVKTLELGWTVTCTSEEFYDLMDSDDEELSVEDFMNSDVLIHAPDFVMPETPTVWED